MFESDPFIKKLGTGIRNRLKDNFYKKNNEININWFYSKWLKHISPGNYSHNLFDKETKFYDGPEYLHAITEIFIEEVYKQELPENAYILDCGSNIGLSVIYLKKNNPSARIIAFEPDKRNFQLLEKNIVSHELKDVELVNKAVWTQKGPISFKSEGNMGSKIDIENSSAEKIEAVRLKDYLTQKVDFLKLDIEGAEYMVIKDIENELSNVENMFLEYHGAFDQNEELCEILDTLNRKGFKFYIKEAANIHNHPFISKKSLYSPYDVQLNLFCFKSLRYKQ